MTKVLFYTWAGMGNLGDDWLLENAVKTAVELGIDCTLLLEPQAEVNGYLSEFQKLHWPRLSASIREKKNFSIQINNFGGLVFAGGGWFAADQGVRNPLVMLARLALVPAQIPIVTLSLGAGKFHGWLGKQISKKIAEKLSKNSPISVRCFSDAEALAGIGVSEVSVEPDLAFLDKGCLINEPKVRDITLISLAEPNLSWHTKESLNTQNTVDQAQKLLEIYRNQLFISFQQGIHNDSLFWSQHFKIEFVEPNGIEEAFSYFSKTQTAIVGRLHAAIAAAISGVPEIYIFGYHHKFDLLSELGLELDGTSPVKAHSNENSRQIIQDLHHAAHYCFKRRLNQFL